MIVVTGANGKLGRKVVEELLKRVPAGDIGVSVRDVNTAQDLKERGVRVRQGNFDDSESLLHAFEKASQVLIISSHSLGEVAVRQHQTAIDSAKKAGVSRLLYTSQMFSSATSHFPPMNVHAATEEMLKSSEMAFTSLRNGFYASSAIMWMGDALKTGELIAPEDGPVGWTTHSDLAEATAVILTEQRYDGITPHLTASEAIDMDRIASIASKVLERPIRRIVVSDDEYRNHLMSRGLPEAMVGMLTGMFQASRQGDFSQTNPVLENLIGRSSVSFTDFLKDSISQ
ncbi:NAD(P)-dependent oxidoreductase [Bacillus atrophaeus]|uniref:SDR family oxidoreductase n=1 Tax=Bacillus atrophaeus TaxID=1452 RepID=UPI000D0666CC|nr:SDR family oxidoreductase [Bacillus atrophaeus]MBJ7898044.1 SDR family oxidoreductase [Bacillus atrophaeus]PSA93460.1 NAD(P)-dependent oxidoreductase [Bacillus atrophaeus]WNV77959.1 SDR family oxidoreductase [Bacillus atrophaeus]